ncbi:heavy metal translocating P-type ATPase [Halomonas dongshanensis]|uniref:P-type Zn(2+) transporter n=1 Tax=Halomonas dongshanensis TaxID=2890835 RepID=A0ABT2ECJ4_9GAMM|nr:heavy metal translocating P-type ATPase [Halomonas dongshanensis]MCS2609219.1 cadmium-translocating P-type ATPase [Halomonas dongshanensis]
MSSCCTSGCHAAPPVSLSSTSANTPKPWWQTPKGQLVLGTGVLLALAWLAKLVWPALGHWPFIAATLVGLVPILQAALRAARGGNVFTIEMLMSIAALGALAIGAAEEAAVVVFLFAVGELLEGVASARARRSISALADLKPSAANLIKPDDSLEEVAADVLTPGQRVRVRPGERIPCDGRVLRGASNIDESPINGESVPRFRDVDDEVFAGTVNLQAVLDIEVTRGSADNTIARVIRLVEQAQAAKAPIARFIDRFAYYYMPAVIGVALLVMVVPPLASWLSWSESVYRALALLLIACPCALVISTPAAIAAGLSAGARQGLLIKGGAVLEQLGKVKIVALDKTGTLTAGAPRVTAIETWTNAADASAILAWAAALESGSSHPLATAIVAEAKAQSLESLPLEMGVSHPGIGIEGVVAGRRFSLSAPARLEVALEASARARIEALEASGHTLTVLCEHTSSETEVGQVRVLGAIALRDEPREDAKRGLAALARLGVTPIMLSGDNPRAVTAIGEQLGIEAHGGLLPEDKAERVAAWQMGGSGPVAKVGDGINDAPALARADVGIAMGSGTAVALEAADAALLKNRVTGVAELIALSRATLGNVKANVALALGLKAIFLFSTALGFTGMWIAVMADTGATVLVTLNALRLLGYRFAL